MGLFSRHQEGHGETPASEVRRFDPPGETSEHGAGAGREPAAGSLRQTALELAERIDEILKLAERTADEVQREAEVSAERYLKERRASADREAESRAGEANRALIESATAIAQLSSSLRAQAERVLGEVTGLERAAREALGAMAGLGDTSAGADGGEAGNPPAPGSEAEPREHQVAAPGEPLLRAAQMAPRGQHS